MVYKRRGMKSNAFVVVPTVLAALLIIGVLVCQPVFSCYGPHITATVSATEIYINENVTVTGKICVGGENETKPDGEGSGPNPPRLLAAAVGHCMSSSLIYCLKKARIPVRDIETTVKTSLFHNEHGKLRIRSIDVQISLKVNEEDEPRVQRCLTLFEDYCTVTQSIRKGIEVNVHVN